MAKPSIQCSEETRLLVKAEAQRLGYTMPKLADEYVKFARKNYQKTIKHDRKQRKKQEVANV